METTEEAKEAVSGMHRAEVDGRTITVETVRTRLQIISFYSSNIETWHMSWVNHQQELYVVDGINVSNQETLQKMIITIFHSTSSYLCTWI
jgi:hypothetical protein